MFKTLIEKRLLSSLLLLFSFTYSIHAFAVPVTLAPWPAPGGTLYTTSGISPGHTGGLTLDMSGFDSSAYGDLYYALGDYNSSGFDPAGPRLWMDSTPDTLSFDLGASDLLGGQAVWIGTTNVVWFNGTSWVDALIATRFTLSITDTASNPLALTDATTIDGMPSSVGAVYHVTGDFSANWLFEAIDPRTGMFVASTELFDSLQNDPSASVFSSVGGAFYYTPPSTVPVPAAVWLFGSGLIGLVGVARRKK